MYHSAVISLLKKSLNIRFLDYRVFLLISTVFLACLIFLSNGYYSDDYQLFIGLKLYNKIHNSALDFRNLFDIRSDGHFTPFYYIINENLPNNYYSLKLIIYIAHILGIFLLYNFTLKIFNRSTAFFTIFFYSINFSIHIKPLAWACFHSHITNFLTGLISIIFLMRYFYKKEKKYLVFYLFFGLLTVLNYETGLFYPLLSCFIFFFLLRESLFDCFRIPENYVIVIIILLPIIFYIASVYYISGHPLPLLSGRIAPQSSSIELTQNTLIDDYRSRKAPRDVYGYSLRGIENGANLLNLTAIEYVIRYYFDEQQSKLWIKKNLVSLFVIIVLLITALILLGYLLLRKSVFKLDLKEKYTFLLLFCSWFTYTFVFFRKDLNQGLALAGALTLGILTTKILESGNKKGVLFILGMFSMPTIMYALTGFDKIYEMRSQSYIKKMNLSFQENAKNEKLDSKLDYFADYVNLYYYINFEKNQSYLHKKYNNMDYFDFESKFSSQESEKIITSK